MKHPNQSFIDGFNRVSVSEDQTPIYLYSAKHTERKRKEKFQCFVESLNNPKKSKNNSVSQAISKIFDYNTLSKSKNKMIVETKQSLGSLPKQFVYNGLLYEFNKEFNVFINQYGHTISLEQATAFMGASYIDPSGTDGAEKSSKPVPPTPVNPIPETPTGLVATDIGTTGVTLEWQDNSTNESIFKIYYRTEEPIPIQVPQTPTGLIASEISSSGVTLSWQDNSTNESIFKIYYRSEEPTPTQVPQTPTGLIASDINNNGVTLSWQDNSTTEEEFKIYYRTE